MEFTMKYVQIEMQHQEALDVWKDLSSLNMPCNQNQKEK